MSMRTTSRVLALTLAALLVSSAGAWARTYTVGPAGAYATIQEAIDIARKGDTVIVTPGVYQERIVFQGRSVVVRSLDSEDATVVANTVIDGSGEDGPVVTFRGDEPAKCVLQGFTITGGATDGAGGGIRGNGTRATITRNVIESNEAEQGGGLHGCAGEVSKNTIRNNSAVDGAGLYGCTGEVAENSITGNSAERYGGGAAFCAAVFTRNTIELNTARDGAGLADCTGAVEANRILANEADGYGGGLARCSGALTNNVIALNSAETTGGGLVGHSGSIYHNTIVANSAGVYAGGIALSSGPVINTIVWGNLAPVQAQIDTASAEPMYSCIEGWEDTDGTNLGEDPLFVAAATGDYDLGVGSPCIDAGGLVAEVLEDLEGDPRGFVVVSELRGDGSAYDIGADEHIPAAYTVLIGVEGSGTVAPAAGEHLFDRDAEVELSAIPAPGWLFVAWEGDLTGAENPATIVMDGPKEVTAVFEPGEYTVTTVVQGSGTLAPAAGTRQYLGGSTVLLTAIPETGWAFDHWEGGLSGNANPATVLVDKDRTITAVFAKLPSGGGHQKPTSPSLTCAPASPGTSSGDVWALAGALGALALWGSVRRLQRG